MGTGLLQYCTGELLFSFMVNESAPFAKFAKNNATQTIILLIFKD